MPRSTRSRATTARRRGFPASGPGKVPAKVVRQRFRDQILHDVAHGLIPRAVDEALRERGVEPVDTPDIKDVVVEEGQPLKFTATFDTVPPIDPGDYADLTVRRRGRTSTTAAVDQALRSCASAAARYEPVEDRGVEIGDSVLMDLVRTAAKKTDEPLIVIPARSARAGDRDRQPPERDGGHRRAGQPAGLRRGARRALTPAPRRRSTSPTRPTTRSRSWPGRR